MPRRRMSILSSQALWSTEYSRFMWPPCWWHPSYPKLGWRMLILRDCRTQVSSWGIICS